MHLVNPNLGERPRVHCTCCGGTGRAPLTKDLWRTLERVRKHSGPARVLDLLERGIGHCAICNRLVELERLGLVKRAGKQGKFHLWEAVKS